jgi:hypothetical protein
MYYITPPWSMPTWLDLVGHEPVEALDKLLKVLFFKSSCQLVWVSGGDRSAFVLQKYAVVLLQVEPKFLLSRSILVGRSTLQEKYTYRL